jgi:pimeloyl-ACP methyl ester carboxylesterase
MLPTAGMGPQDRKPCSEPIPSKLESMRPFTVAAAALVVARLAPAQEGLSLRASDGWPIAAQVYGSGDRGVVLAHGGRFTKESWVEQARVLAGAGFRVVALDFRGFGESRGPAPRGASADTVHLDVLAAVRHLRATGAKTVSVVGGSFGGGAAAQASVEAEPGEIDRLVLLAHSPIEHPERMKGRKLFVVARGDLGSGDVPRLPGIRAQFERATARKELIVLDGSAHAQFLFATGQADRLMREILRFLGEP